MNKQARKNVYDYLIAKSSEYATAAEQSKKENRVIAQIEMYEDMSKLFLQLAKDVNYEDFDLVNKQKYKEELMSEVSYRAKNVYGGLPIDYNVLDDICKEILCDKNI